MELLGLLKKFEVAAAHVGPDRFQLRGHVARVVAQVDRLAVLEKAAPLRVQPHHGNVVFEAFAGFFKHAAQHGGLDQDGRAHVEAEALLVELCRLAAEPRVLLKHGNLVPAGGECACGGKPGESASYDSYLHCVVLLLQR